MGKWQQISQFKLSQKTNLNDTNLNGTNLNDTNFNDINFKDTNLNDTNLNDTNRNDTNFRRLISQGWYKSGWLSPQSNAIMSQKHPPPHQSLNLGTLGQHQSLCRQYRELISRPEPTAHQFPILPIGALMLAKCS